MDIFHPETNTHAPQNAAVAGITSLVFMGAANSFREIYPLIQEINEVKLRYQVVAIVDDDPRFYGTTIEGIPVVGPLEEVQQFSNAKIVFGIASYKSRLLREKILRRLNLPFDRFETILHPSSRIYPSASIGPGVIVYPGTIICNDATIEAFSVLTFDVIVGPYVRLGTCSMIASRSVILSGAIIGRSAFIGAGSIIGEKVEVGAAAVVVMGSVVFQSIRSGAIVQGNPGRRVIQGPVPDELADQHLKTGAPG